LLSIGTAAKSKIVEGFAGWQAGLDEMALDPPPATLGKLEFGEH